MKKYLSLLLLVFITSLTFAQIYNPDIIYLKNGSVIKGEIIERIPDKEVKIKTASGSVFVYQADEIDKITTEKEEKKKKESEEKENVASSDKTFEKRNGYIGISLGVSIPVGEYGGDGGLAERGAQFNLVNFGYLFTEHIGVSGMWSGAANPIKNISGIEEGTDPWTYSGLLVGPLFSIPIQENINIDFRPMIGFANTTIPDLDDGDERTFSSAFNMGSVLRFDVSDDFLLMLTVDYFTTTPEFDKYPVRQPINTFTLGVGAAFKLN